MKRVSAVVLSIGVLCAYLVGCTGAEGAVTSSGFSATAETAIGPETGTETGVASFVWRPDAKQGYGSDVANRRAYGNLDGGDGMLYFRAYNGRESPLCSLFSLDEATGETKELADDCYGMVNLAGDCVFYIGEVSEGVFCYNTQTRQVTQVYEGPVLNLLATRDYVYIISQALELLELERGSGAIREVMKGVWYQYLEAIQGAVYFAQMMPDEMHCRLYRIPPGAPGGADPVYDGVACPLKVMGTRVLCGGSESAELLDMDSGQKVSLYRWDSGAGLPAANGNGVFHVTIDDQGYAELSVFDLERETTSTLMPVHGGAVYFVDGEMYLVSPANLDIERVILDPSDPRTEWVVRGDSPR